MKVGFNARLLHSPKIRGWNRYTQNLLSELSKTGVELYLYSDQDIHPTYLGKLQKGTYQVRISRPMKYLLWESIWLARQCQNDKLDLFHCPFHFGLPWKSTVKKVLTLHDAIELAYYSPIQSWSEKYNKDALQYRFYHWMARKNADHIITVSEFSKYDLTRLFNVSPEKISVIYEAADEAFFKNLSDSDEEKARERHDLHRPYFLYIGGLEKRKNIPFLLRAFALSGIRDADLVIGGEANEGDKEHLKKLSSALNISNLTKWIGHIDDRDLPSLYSGAISFVLPSNYEGFGLQMCEAMAVGCPVLASRATSLPEVLGEGGATFPLNDPNELASLMKRLATEPDYRSRLSEMALKRSQNFSWKKAATETLEVYRRLIEG